ncbi:hypothetical protein KBZ13_07240 [Cyanobium sp. ATX 6F1]|nr:hypothetical protein [Cyanobium sp. ATX 6F1]
MNQNKPAKSMRIELRWPASLAVLVLWALERGLPNRFRLLPAGFDFISFGLVLIPMLAVGLTAGRSRWLRIERLTTSIFVIAAGGITFVTLVVLIKEMLFGRGDLDALELLASGVAIWVSNVVIFSLAFWQVDRGGPEARLNRLAIRADWFFPQEGVPDAVRPDWRPTFIDYLFLSFSTATAFSPTGAIPLNARSQLMLMLQSTISLLTIAVIAARAINILGS